MKFHLKLYSLIILSILLCNEVEAQKQQVDKEFVDFYKNFENARKKKDIQWFKDNTYDKVNVSLSNSETDEEVKSKKEFFSRYFNLFEEGYYIGKKTIIELSMQDNLFSLNNCLHFSYEPTKKMYQFYKYLSKDTRIFAVHYKKVYKSYVDENGDEIGGSYEGGILFARINGKFLLIGIWDCSVG